MVQLVWAVDLQKGFVSYKYKQHCFDYKRDSLSVVQLEWTVDLQEGFVRQEIIKRPRGRGDGGATSRYREAVCGDYYRGGCAL